MERPINIYSDSPGTSFSKIQETYIDYILAEKTKLEHQNKELAKKLQDVCTHEHEQMKQGDGRVYGDCLYCGKELY